MSQEAVLGRVCNAVRLAADLETSRFSRETWLNRTGARPYDIAEEIDFEFEEVVPMHVALKWRTIGDICDWVEALPASLNAGWHEQVAA